MPSSAMASAWVGILAPSPRSSQLQRLRIAAFGIEGRARRAWRGLEVVRAELAARPAQRVLDLGRSRGTAASAAAACAWQASSSEAAKSPPEQALGAMRPELPAGLAVSIGRNSSRNCSARGPDRAGELMARARCGSRLTSDTPARASARRQVGCDVAPDLEQ